MSFLIGGMAGVVYLYFLYHYSRSNKSFFRILLVVATSAAALYFVADLSVLYAIVGGGKFDFAVLVLAIFHTLELFIFQTHFFDNGYNEFFFGDEQTSPLIPLSGDTYAYIYVISFVLACITSVALIIRAFSRRRSGREWLRKNKNYADVSHLFFIESKMATILAKDIKANYPDQPCILIGYPNPDEEDNDLSIGEKFVRLFKSRNDNPIEPFDAVVYSKIPLGSTNGMNICQQMSLKELAPYLQCSSCKVYLLSDNEEDNLHSAELLVKDSCKAEIFCRACREGENRMYEEAMSNTSSNMVHLVDSSYLAVREILNCPDMLPVNFVDKGIDKQGRKEGWVSSAFNAMILGFGETGREVLGFVFEHAAFVGQDEKKSPFSCVVMDRNMDNLEQAYQKKAPGMNEDAGISYIKCEIGSNDYWNTVSDKIESLNYIVICMGDDRTNLKTAVDIVEFAYRSGKDISHNFAVLVAQEKESPLGEIAINHYNDIESYHKCIHPFGGLNKVLTYGNVTNEYLKARAIRYFSAYLQSSGENVDGETLWNKRDNDIVETKDYANFAKRVRQRSQDYANCFHVSTKLALIDSEIKEHGADIAQCIPGKYEGKHYDGNDPFVENTLRYMAVGEHIRWEASHIVLGYTLGDVTDDIKKTHDCIKKFDMLSPDVQHYDYLVVKTTLKLVDEK